MKSYSLNVKQIIYILLKIQTFSQTCLTLVYYVSDVSQNANGFPSVEEYRLKNPENIAIGHLNGNFLRGKMTQAVILTTLLISS